MGKLSGVAEMKGKLRKFAQRYPQVVGDAAYEEMKVELEESNRRIPVETGAARDSGVVTGPEISAFNIQVGIAYPGDPGATNPKGGLVADYIVPLHENLEAHHPNGEAKFLESTLNESQPHMGARIAARAQVDKVTL